MSEAHHRSTEELEAGLEEVLRAPRDEGVLEMIVRRPEPGEREVLEEGELDLALGLVGDDWSVRGSRHTPDGSAHPEMQLNVMGSRVVALVAGDRARWALAGDQLLVDLDLSEENLPVGARVAIGEAEIEVTAPPHLGCAKFSARFGNDALRFVNAKGRRHLRLRGVNAKVVRPGTVRRGDAVRRLAPAVSLEGLDARRPEVAEEIRRVMTASYRVEADLLGADDFPPLEWTAEAIASADARFIGAFVEGRLAGVMELEEPADGPVNIASLVVDPAFFRRGVGTRFVRYVLEARGDRPLTVSTGRGNRPALELYERLGFREERRWSTDCGLPMSTLVRGGDEAG
jgi:ribosomal protein S18 acetylase RimI-like enzyme